VEVEVEEEDGKVKASNWRFVFVSKLLLVIFQKGFEKISSKNQVKVG
jgi:hypothetical protein